MIRKHGLYKIQSFFVVICSETFQETDDDLFLHSPSYVKVTGEAINYCFFHIKKCSSRWYIVDSLKLSGVHYHLP